MQNLNLKDYVTVPEAEKILNKTRAGIHWIMKTRWNGKCFQLGRMWLIPKKEIETYLKEKEST